MQSLNKLMQFSVLNYLNKLFLCGQFELDHFSKQSMMGCSHHSADGRDDTIYKFL